MKKVIKSQYLEVSPSHSVWLQVLDTSATWVYSNRVDIVTRTICKVFKECGLRNNEICSKTGLVKAEVSMILAGKRNISLERAILLCRKLDKLECFDREYMRLYPIIRDEIIASIDSK